MMNFSGQLLASILACQRRQPRPGMMRKLARARHTFWSILTQSDIAPEAKLGKNLMLPHPNGVVIHEDAVVGDDCMIMQQVTIGMIGDGARIGANAVVTTDVPAGCTAVGVPAKIIKRSPE